MTYLSITGEPDAVSGEGEGGLLRPRKVRGASDLLVDGKEKIPLPFSLEALKGEPGQR